MTIAASPLKRATTIIASTAFSLPPPIRLFRSPSFRLPANKLRVHICPSIQGTGTYDVRTKAGEVTRKLRKDELIPVHAKAQGAVAGTKFANVLPNSSRSSTAMTFINNCTVCDCQRARQASRAAFFTGEASVKIVRAAEGRKQAMCNAWDEVLLCWMDS